MRENGTMTIDNRFFQENQLEVTRLAEMKKMLITWLQET